MASPFSITTSLDSITLSSKGQAESKFTLSNNSDRPIRTEILITAIGKNCDKKWFSLSGSDEREMQGKSTEEVKVEVTVSDDAPPGSYDFRIDVASVENPDEDYAEGPPVSFKVAEKEVKKPFPWVPIVIAAAALITVSLLTWIIFGLGSVDKL